MKKILIIISLILILFLSYGYYDGYVQKEITVGKNIYTHVHYTMVGKENSLYNPMSAYEIDLDEWDINVILKSVKELELLGEENFIKKYDKRYKAQVEMLNEEYNLFLHKQKLLKANIKKKNVYPISLFGYVPPLKDSLIEPKNLTFEVKKLKKTNVWINGKIEQKLMEVYDDGTYVEVDRDYYKSIRIVFELKKIDKFNVNRVDLNIGNMKSYNPFTWKNIQHTSCYFDSGYYNYWGTNNYNTKIFKCDFSLPSNYDYNDITAFQFDKIVGYKKPIKIFSIIFEPAIRLQNSIFNLFSRS